jgi:hypothetical protein
VLGAGGQIAHRVIEMLAGNKEPARCASLEKGQNSAFAN